MAKAPTDIRSLARSHSVTAINTLKGIMQQSDAPPAARVAAACALLDRGWGKPPQAHTGADGEGAIQVTIRHLVEGMPDEHRIIEAVPIATRQRRRRAIGRGAWARRALTGSRRGQAAATGENGEGGIEVIIRQVVEGGDEALDAR